MTTFIYSATASADGYIAGPGGDMSWLNPFLGAEPDPVFERLTARITALLQGRITYDGDDPNAGDADKEGAFEGEWHGPQILLTHRPVDPVPPDLTIAGDLDSALEASRAAAGSHGSVSVLGADIARQCLEAGALDEVIISTVPLLLGGGTALLNGAQSASRLALLDRSTTAAGHTAHYRVVRER